MPRYFTLSSPGTTIRESGVPLLVTTSCCLPYCSSTWATSLRSGEMAAKTDVPVFVNCFMVHEGGGGSKVLLTQRATAGRKRSKVRTPVAPAKAVAVLCVLISLKIESAV